MATAVVGPVSVGSEGMVEIKQKGDGVLGFRVFWMSWMARWINTRQGPPESGEAAAVVRVAELSRGGSVCECGSERKKDGLGEGTFGDTIGLGCLSRWVGPIKIKKKKNNYK